MSSPLTALLDAAAEVATCAGELVAKIEADNAELRTKAAQASRQVVQVPAANATSASVALVNETVDKLVAHAYLDSASRDKVANALLSNPDEALRLVAHILDNESAHAEGCGISISANATKSSADIDGWSDVARKGAV